MVSCVDFSADGHKIVSGSFRGNIRVCDLQNGR